MRQDNINKKAKKVNNKQALTRNRIHVLVTIQSIKEAASKKKLLNEKKKELEKDNCQTRIIQINYNL